MKYDQQLDFWQDTVCWLAVDSRLGTSSPLGLNAGGVQRLIAEKKTKNKKKPPLLNNGTGREFQKRKKWLEGVQFMAILVLW